MTGYPSGDTAARIGRCGPNCRGEPGPHTQNVDVVCREVLAHVAV